MYSEYVSSTNYDMTVAGITTTKIDNIDFESNWSSEASSVLLTKLNENIQAINNLKKQLDMFNSVLTLTNQYIVIVQKIADLQAQLNSIVGDDDEADAQRARISAQIADLEQKKKALRDKIHSMLSALTTSVESNDVGDVNPVDAVPDDTTEDDLTEDEELTEDITEDTTVDKDEVSLSAGDVITGDNNWNGDKLEAKNGFNENGPSGYETWYPLEIDKVVENMETLYGHTNVEYKIREDGVRTLSGVTPDGVVYKDLVIVAADVRHPTANPNGTFERGQIVETSLGTGIVADYCEAAVNRRKGNGGVHFDIATAWWEEPWYSQIYGKK